jgi:CheY-like chemotaxis protein
MARVLIAASDANLGYVLGNELEDEGHRVGRMPPGMELTAYVANGPAYDVVLIDFLTSCLTDLRSLRSIKKTCPHIHIIVFSDRVAPQERAALLTNGADKSFMKHEINDLKEHLRNEFKVHGSGGDERLRAC